jgi:hypothetical protein
MPTLRPTLIAFLLVSFFGIHAQNTPAHLAYDGVLWSPNDTFYVKAVIGKKPGHLPPPKKIPSTLERMVFRAKT